MIYDMSVKPAKILPLLLHVPREAKPLTGLLSPLCPVIYEYQPRWKATRGQEELKSVAAST